MVRLAHLLDTVTDDQLNTAVKVAGWIRSRRDSKAGFSFLELNDGSCIRSIQCVAGQDLENYETEIKRLSAGCAVQVHGKLVQSEGKGQSVEIQATSVQVVGWVDDPENYPIAKKRHSFEFLRTQAHLRARTNTFGAVNRVRSRLAQSVHRFFDERGFFLVHTPIISTSDCEGAGELLRVSHFDLANVPKTDENTVDWNEEFFGQPTYLTVSGQLHGEALACAMGQVYTFGPTFRAEDSHTSRHLAEFWMIEPEIAFADLQDLTALSSDFVAYLAKAVLDQCQQDLAFFQQRVDSTVITRLEQLAQQSVAILTYTKAIEILESASQNFEFPVGWGIDLASEHERYIAEQYCQGPVILTDYPKGIKAFYMRQNDDRKTVAAMDLLVPGLGELIGGSQREERIEMLDLSMQGLNLSEELWWYRDLRRFGTVPHGGFGLGFERLVSYFTGMDNVRDTIAFPRVAGSAKF